MDRLSAAREALATGRWSEAHRLLDPAETAEELEALSDALWWLDQVPKSLEVRERAFAIARQDGNARLSIRIAAWLSREHQASYGNSAIANGWLARAERLAAEDGPSIELAYIEFLHSKRAADPAVAQEHATRAMEIAREFGDVDMEMTALSEVGRALVTRGKIDEGMRHLDEAVAAATCGEMTRWFLISDTCCNMVSACERAADYARLAQWCSVVDDFSERFYSTPVLASCHTLYGGALIATGRWPQAAKELESATRMFERSHPILRTLALARLALLRVREGKYEEAREILVGIEELPASAEPVAALELALGNPATAAVVLRRHLRDAPEDPLTAVPLLDLLTVTMLALGDEENAGKAAARLAEIAARANRPAFRAYAVRAHARVDRDCHSFEDAAALFEEASLPFHAAVCHLELAESCRDNDAAVCAFSARVARETFERLGATTYADRAAQILRDLGIRGRPTPRAVESLTKRERQVFDLVASGLSNGEIGERLFISAKTVEHHVGRILTKLGVRGRVDIAAIVRKR